MPSDFQYDEMVKLPGYFDFEEVKMGKKPGPRVKFLKPEGIPMMLHNPHASRFKKCYQQKPNMEYWAYEKLGL
jgi:hypothetical protein